MDPRPNASCPILLRTACRALATGLIVASLAACGNGQPAAATGPAAAVPGSAQQVEAQVGTATVYATAMQTSSIPAEVAREHGIERRDDLVMLRVSARQGDAGTTTTAPVQVRGTVTGLRGQVQPLAFKEAMANGLVDHVATFPVELPDTLRFELQVVTPDGARETLQLTREFQTR